MRLSTIVFLCLIFANNVFAQEVQINTDVLKTIVIGASDEMPIKLIPPSGSDNTIKLVPPKSMQQKALKAPIKLTPTKKPIKPVIAKPLKPTPAPKVVQTKIEPTKAIIKADKPETKEVTQKTETKAEDKQTVKAEIKTEIKPEVKPVVKAEVKPAIKAEVKPVVKAEVKPVIKPVVKEDVVTAPAKEVVKAEVKPVVKTEVKPVVKTEVKPVVKPVVKEDVKPETKKDVKAQEPIAIKEEVEDKTKLPFFKAKPENKVEPPSLIGEEFEEKAKSEKLAKPESILVKQENKSTEGVEKTEENKFNPIVNPIQPEEKIQDIVKQLPSGSDIIVLNFEQNETDLSPENIDALKNAVIAYTDDNSKSFRIIGYASSTGESFHARRTSLTRAVNTRIALLDLDIHSSRIEIQALGDKSPDEIKDKVRVIVLEK